MSHTPHSRAPSVASLALALQLAVSTAACGSTTGTETEAGAEAETVTRIMTVAAVEDPTPSNGAGAPTSVPAASETEPATETTSVSDRLDEVPGEAPIPSIPFSMVTSMALGQGLGCRVDTGMVVGHDVLCEMRTPTELHRVWAVGPDESAVHWIRATIGGEPGSDDPTANAVGMAFLDKFARLEFDGSDPEGTADWMGASMGEERAELDVGTVRFTFRWQPEGAGASLELEGRQ